MSARNRLWIYLIGITSLAVAALVGYASSESSAPTVAANTPPPVISYTLLPTVTPEVVQLESAPSPGPTVSSDTDTARLASLTPAAAPARSRPAIIAATFTPEAAGCGCNVEHVVIISIDGLRPDALELADTPVLDALRAAGAYSGRAQAVLPSVTLVNHASMLGGMGPDKHGIDWNEADLERGRVAGPTVFSVAREAGLSTAMVVGKPKLEHLVLPDSVDSYYYAGYTDYQIVEQALAVIVTGLPDLLFIHLPDVDSAGHLTGWMSSGQLIAVNLTDSQIGRLVTALESKGYLDATLLLITADHGGTGYRHGSASPEDTTIPWLAVGPGVAKGTVLNTDIIVYDTAATALYVLNIPVPEIWDGQPVLEIFD